MHWSVETLSATVDKELEALPRTYGQGSRESAS